MITLRSKTERELLNFFFTHEDARLYVNELVRRLDIDKRNLIKKLAELEKLGLFTTDFVGNLKFYSLNKKFPFYKEYRNIIQKTAGIEAQLRKNIAKLDGVKRAFIYGSFVTNKMDTSSDIDVMIIGDHDVIEMQKQIGSLQKQYDREINVMSLGEKEFKAKKKDPFISGVLKKKRIELL